VPHWLRIHTPSASPSAWRMVCIAAVSSRRRLPSSGAIIAANSLVNKDVPDYAIAGGMPAKVLRYRFPEEQRKALLEIAWWDWPDDEVRKAVPLLAAKDIDAFIDYARERQRAGAVPQPRAVGAEPTD